MAGAIEVEAVVPEEVFARFADTPMFIFGGSLLLEEIIFWLGTTFVTLSAVLIFAELERRGVTWWILPAGVILPINWLIQMIDTNTPISNGPNFERW